MFERFTERARKAMALANQEAQRLNHDYIGTEHALLGLVKEGAGVGAGALKNLGVDLDKVRAEVEKLVNRGPDRITKDKLPMTPRMKLAVDYAIEESRSLNQNYIGTEHLLLGLLRESEGVAAQVLLNLGLALANVREEVVKLLATRAAPQEGPAPAAPRLPLKPATHLNVEVKARLPRPDKARKILKDAGANFRGTDEQVDTYFRCPRGRLKLREGAMENALIHYDRPDVPGPKESVVTLCPVSDTARLREVLARALGVLATVEKKREIYFIENVKFHIDDVATLGSFIEIEAQDAGGTLGVAKLREQCKMYIRQLGISERDLLDGSYADMIPPQ